LIIKLTTRTGKEAAVNTRWIVDAEEQSDGLTRIVFAPGGWALNVKESAAAIVSKCQPKASKP